MTQEALPASPNQNDEEAARDEKGHELRELSPTHNTKPISGFFSDRQAGPGTRVDLTGPNSAPTKRYFGAEKFVITSISVRTITPEPPRVTMPSSAEPNAGPAMSRCAHGRPSTNSWRNNPATLEPA